MKCVLPVFFKISEDKVREMYNHKSMDTELLLFWSKLLKYDLFRIYSQHLVLYAPPTPINYNEIKSKSIPQFRKNIYTIEIIEFILDLIDKREKKKSDIVKEYNIPRATLYKWIEKYKKRMKPNYKKFILIYWNKNIQIKKSYVIRF